MVRPSPIRIGASGADHSAVSHALGHARPAAWPMEMPGTNPNRHTQAHGQQGPCCTACEGEAAFAGHAADESPALFPIRGVLWRWVPSLPRTAFPPSTATGRGGFILPPPRPSSHSRVRSLASLPQARGRSDRHTPVPVASPFHLRNRRFPSPNPPVRRTTSGRSRHSVASVGFGRWT